jgi:acyl-CoA synthetase (AMP-forming)/AMP-acid ligase II
MRMQQGDLGVAYGGELFVTGRRKEMVIVRGQKFYPADVEACLRLQAPLFHAMAGASQQQQQQQQHASDAERRQRAALAGGNGVCRVRECACVCACMCVCV